jgi:hypothetical protein
MSLFAGAASRKKTLIDHGFRLPSAADNRPLKFDEFEQQVGQEQVLFDLEILDEEYTPLLFESPNTSYRYLFREP